MVRKTIVRMSEQKDVQWAPAVYELYHNAGSPASGRLGNFVTLNQTAFMPVQGSGDNTRNGDRIYMTGIQVAMMLGQKWDRPNVTFKIIVARVPKGTSCTMTTFFRVVASNILLDSINTDYVKRILYYKTIKSNKTLMAAGTDIGVFPLVNLINDPGPDAITKEHTFPHKFYVPIKKEYKFSSDNGVQHNDDDIMLWVGAYDAQGTLETDNIGYFRLYVKLNYRDF